jgi:SAM-dependent methyltransferase
MKYKEIKRCRICGNEKLIPILNLGVQSLAGRFPEMEEPDPLKTPLELVKCNKDAKSDACGLLQLKHTVLPEEMYAHNYGYRSGINKTMTDHLRGLVGKITDIVTLNEGDVVLDIGSNDATLLKSYNGSGLQKVGIDPTGEQFRKYYTEDIKLVCDFFNIENYRSVMPEKKVKVISSIAMFYDLDKPMDFVKDIKEILHPDGIWVFEQSYMPEMLKKNSFDTICQEHLEYYSLGPIDWMLKKTSLRILRVEFNEINGGSFRIYACHENSGYKSDRNNIEKIFETEAELKLDTIQPYIEFKERIEELRDKLINFLTKERENGKSIYIYGASTKGNVLLQYYNIDKNLIIAAADRNPEKWGLRTPTTDIPIISEEEARGKNPDYFLVLPWHFKEEFLKREEDFLKSGGKFIFPLPEIEIIGK